MKRLTFTMNMLEYIHHAASLKNKWRKEKSPNKILHLLLENICTYFKKQKTEMTILI